MKASGIVSVPLIVEKPECYYELYEKIKNALKNARLRSRRKNGVQKFEFFRNELEKELPKVIAYDLAVHNFQKKYAEIILKSSSFELEDGVLRVADFECPVSLPPYHRTMYELISPKYLILTRREPVVQFESLFGVVPARKGSERLIGVDVNRDNVTIFVEKCGSAQFVFDSSDLGEYRNARHKIAHIITDVALGVNGRIVLEDFRDSTYQKNMNRYFLMLWKEIIHKAFLKGVPYSFISPSFTSRMCPICMFEMVSAGGRTLKCPHCGVELDRDVVASFNIITKYYHRHRWSRRKIVIGDSDGKYIGFLHYNGFSERLVRIPVNDSKFAEKSPKSVAEYVIDELCPPKNF